VASVAEVRAAIDAAITRVGDGPDAMPAGDDLTSCLTATTNAVERARSCATGL
jgi:hypothetical protein